MGGVGGVLAWVACMRVSVGGVGGVGSVLTWPACYYYCYCLLLLKCYPEEKHFKC